MRTAKTYNHNLAEKKWAAVFQSSHVNDFYFDETKPKLYLLDMFPYPSGKGLHLGHVKSYLPNDVLTRYKRYNSYNVLHPMGWDAFGLPAEQYALQTKQDPAVFTWQNIANFKQQLDKMGFSFAWNHEVNTADPHYYAWTQWIFQQLYLHGLASLQMVKVNWCEQLQTVLANEEVYVGKDGQLYSERGDFVVVQKPMRQWVLKITKYADRLLKDLDLVDWPEHLKTIQSKWIGAQQGYTITTTLTNATTKVQIPVFTADLNTFIRADGLFLDCNHPWVLQQAAQNPELQAFLQAQVQYTWNTKNSAVNEKQSTAYLLDYQCVHPLTKALLPVLISPAVDYQYNTYAQFISAFADPFWQTWFSNKRLVTNQWQAFVNQQAKQNPIWLNLLAQACMDNANEVLPMVHKLVFDQLKNNNQIQATVGYKLKDWIFSRQRYWGEPFPILYDAEQNTYLEGSLPLVLPKASSIAPGQNGQGPLSNITSWNQVTTNTTTYYRDTNTMPQWAGSSWYYVAYLLKKPNQETYWPLNSRYAKKLLATWLPVDLYVGGQEHAVLHLLYARFWHKFLYDLQIVSHPEPFHKIINQGMILNSDGAKMSKSKGNAITPDEIVTTHGADCLRLYLLFAGPVTAPFAWQEQGLDGMYKWVQRVYRLFQEKSCENNGFIPDHFLTKYHTFLHQINTHLDAQEFNLAISAMMVFVNQAYQLATLPLPMMVGFLVVLSCFAPFLAQTLYAQITNSTTNLIFTKEKWPAYEAKYLNTHNTIDLPIQINGKLRMVLQVSKNATLQQIMPLVTSAPALQKWLEGKTISKEIYVPDKILNLIVK